MNSKEALEKLLEMAIENGLWKSGLVEDIENIILQDLEVLEILKKHLYVHQTNAKDLFELRAIFDLETYDEEERQENQKVKEWLEN